MSDNQEVATQEQTPVLSGDPVEKTPEVDLVDQFLKAGVDSKRIGYFSFTKKAATEAATRAADKFNLDIENDLPFFRTLHSYAFNQ